MEGRPLKVVFSKSGSGSITSRLSIPITDLRDMGVNPEDRELEYYYDKETKTITLRKIN